MQQPDHITKQPFEDDEVEIIDLDEIASPAHTKGISRPRRQLMLNRKHLRYANMLGTLLIVLVLILLNFKSIGPRLFGVQNTPNFHITPPFTTLKPSLVIPQQQNGFVCTLDQAWSPNSKLIAILGFSRVCEFTFEEGYGQGLITVNDATTGRRIAQIEPDTAIKHIFHQLDPTIQGGIGMYYLSPLWSRTGKRLACEFIIMQWNQNTQGPTTLAQGEFLANADGTHQQVLMHLTSLNDWSGEWDLQQDQMIQLALTPPIRRPSAVKYTWGNAGKLIPKASSYTSGPIGNPSRDALFTIWQPGGIIMLDQLSGNDTPERLYNWYTSFAAWSPDERYLANISIGGILLAPGQSPPASNISGQIGLSHAYFFLMRDAGLQHFVTTLPENTPFSAHALIAGATITWSPDGQLLATYIPKIDEANHVDIYSTSTGKRVAALALPPHTNTKAAHTEYLSSYLLHWSTDGTQALTTDPQSGATVIWRS